MPPSFFACQYSLFGSSRTLSSFARLASIAIPSLLHKHTRSKGPSLHQSYPASSVHLTLSDTQMIRRPCGGVHGSRRRDHPGPPLLALTAFLACCAHYPGESDRCTMVIVLTRSRAGLFPIHSAFPALAPGRHPHCTFRGLLKLYTHYGPPDCSPTMRGLCREVSITTVTRANRSPAIESNHQLFEWVLPPLVISPFWAHAEACTTFANKRLSVVVQASACSFCIFFTASDGRGSARGNAVQFRIVLTSQASR